jgi:hypothetical protein
LSTSPVVRYWPELRSQARNPPAFLPNILAGSTPTRT